MWATLILLLLIFFILISYTRMRFIIEIGLVDNQFIVELIFKSWFKNIKNDYYIDFEKVLEFFKERKEPPITTSIPGISLIYYYLQHARVKEFIWISHIGLEDAAQTGYFTGSLWAFKGFCLAFLANKNRLTNFQVNIYPDFEKNVFSSRLSCILRIRIVHIIHISISLLFAKVRGQYYGFRSERAV